MTEKWNNPIEILKPKLHKKMNHLSSDLSAELQETLLKFKIVFIYNNDPIPIQTPKGNLEKSTIELQDIYMAFLWCCCYATVSFTKMYYSKAKLGEDIVELNDMPNFTKSALTMNWARSLKHEVSFWPKNAGRPDIEDDSTEAANNLYYSCVAYLLFHEIGHVIKHQHLLDLAKRRLNPFYELTSEDRKHIHDAEVEADQFALECLIGTTSGDDVKMIKYLGAVLAQLSNFYLLDTPDTRGGTHPDYDVRLRAILEKTDLQSEANRMQLNAQVSVGLQLFFKLTSKEFISEDKDKNFFQNFEELEDHLFSLIDSMKREAR